MPTEYEYRFEPLKTPSVRYKAGWRVVPGILQRGANADGSDAGLVVLLEYAHEVTEPSPPAATLGVVQLGGPPARPAKPAKKAAAKKAGAKRR